MVKNKSPFEELYQNNEFKHLDLSLNRIIKALNEIAFDERDLGKIIHIAGTNGKGSTAKFISDMLLNENYNVALYTSPHIDTINERIVYNGEPIKDNEMNNLLFELKTVIVENELSYFEALTFLAFKYFSDKKPQFSIIETGLGGRFDATNVLNDKLPVITSISFDHAEILGKNIFKIADEKLAIVKNNKEVFIGYNKPFIRKYITQQLNDRILIFADKIDNELHYPYPYCYNYVLAKSIFYHLIGKKYKSYQQSAKFLMDYGIDLVIVKLGETGCYICRNEEEYFIESFKVKCIDTTGAGDAFNAGFIYSYLTGKNIEKAGITGNYVASLCIKRYGSTKGLPGQKELKEIKKELN